MGNIVHLNKLDFRDSVEYIHSVRKGDSALDLKEKLGYYKNALEIDPFSSEVWYKIGHIYFGLGNYEKMEKCYVKADGDFSDIMRYQKSEHDNRIMKNDIKYTENRLKKQGKRPKKQNRKLRFFKK